MVHALTESSSAQSRVAAITRDSYGRLLALLAAPTGDIASAEDALSDAFERALQRWPRDGVPDNPEAWILTVARNRLRDLWKSSAYRLTRPLPDDHDPAEDSAEPAEVPDRRLELMLVCAHPAIAPDARTPLMLQTVLGVDAAAIAGAFAVAPATMAQRLVRAKKRVRDARIPFVLPERADLADRLPGVLEAVYGAYAIDWQTTESAVVDSLSTEALHLALILAELLPDEPEVLGLAALLSLCEARRTARRDTDGRFIPLDAQDASRWDRALIERGERMLTRAHGFSSPGRFQYEAAIQSAQCARPVDQAALRRLHRALVQVAPTLGAVVALAALDGEIDGPQAGLRSLDAIDNPAVARFQPAWVTRAHLLSRAGRTDGAVRAYHRAIELTPQAEVASYLRRQLDALT